jgi:hypothetical protein
MDEPIARARRECSWRESFAAIIRDEQLGNKRILRVINKTTLRV